MNKHMVLYLILVLLAVLGLGGFSLAGGMAQNDISIREETLAGDIRQVGNLKITVPGQADYHTYWSTCFSAAEDPAPETHFSYSIASLEPEDGPSGAFSATKLFNPRSVSTESLLTRDILPDQLNEPLRELVKTMEPGQTSSKTVTLRDYAYYYDFFLSITIPQGASYYSYTAPDNYLHNYFQIPFPDSVEITITAAMSEDGTNVTVFAKPTDGAYFGFANDFLIRNDWIYLILSPADFPEGTDFSRIRSGYGIYRIPLPRSREEGLQIEKIENVFPLSWENLEDITLTRSPWSDKLLLFTVEDGKLRLRILEEATFTVLEDYHLPSLSSIPSVVMEEDLLVLISRGEENRPFQALIREEGQYIPWLSGTLPEAASLQYDLAAASNGRQLALASRWQDYTSSAVELIVYDETGLLYRGIFSQNGEHLPQGINRATETALELQWNDT